MKKNFRLIISLLVLTMVVFIVYNVSQLDNETSEKQYEHLVNDLSRVTNNFSIWLNHKKDMLNTSKEIIGNFRYEDIIYANTGNRYLNINNENTDVSQLYIGLKDGGFVTGGQWIPPEDYDPLSRTWYKEAVLADDTIVSKVYVDRETGNQLVTISSPLYLSGEFIGVISADVFLNNIHEYLQSQITDHNIYTYLLDEDGMIIIHTIRDDLIGKNLYTDVKNQVIIDYFEEVKIASDIVLMEYVYDNQNIRGIIQKVNNENWYLSVALVYENNFLSTISIDKSHIFVNVFGLFIMFILISMLLRLKVELDNTNRDLTNETEKDFLTGIYNRKYLNQYLNKLWKVNYGKREVSVLMMDIDNFKAYNDTYGHIYGDEVLVKLTACITETVRKGDIFARYGGEEFSLVLDGVTSDIAYKVADNIRKAVYDLNILHESSISKRITISVGVITTVPDNQNTIRDVIDQADNALYEAKASGRNTVVSC